MRKGLTDTVIIVSSVALLTCAGLIASRKKVETIKPVHSIEAAAPEEEFVFVTSSGKKYHVKGECGGMKNPIAVTLAEAAENGYEPCSICVPGG